MISSNNTLEVYVHWKFHVSITWTSIGVMTLDCGNIQVNENTDVYYILYLSIYFIRTNIYIYIALLHSECTLLIFTVCIVKYMQQVHVCIRTVYFNLKQAFDGFCITEVMPLHVVLLL